MRNGRAIHGKTQLRGQNIASAHTAKSLEIADNKKRNAYAVVTVIMPQVLSVFPASAKISVWLPNRDMKWQH